VATGGNRAEIRGEAANLFVELERFLSDLMFMTWVLCEDHYMVTHFRFELAGYHEQAAELFKTYQGNIGTANPIVYDENGRNTLFPLVSGFRLLGDYCRWLITNSDQFVRSTGSPGYTDRATVGVFPFRHTRYFLDLSENTKTSIIAELISITNTLETAKTAGIRNRIEHNREDFPIQEEISSFLDSLLQLTDRMQKIGIAPLSYTVRGLRSDRWGRFMTEYENYRGEAITVPYRAELDGSGLPRGRQDFLILVPAIKIGDTEEITRFTIIESSEYREQWKDYPIKRLNFEPSS
jgi:hypothetical protein